MSRASILTLALLVTTACAPPPSGGGASEDQAQRAAESNKTPAPPNPSVPGVVGDAALDTALGEALAAKGPGYTPRTEHRLEDGRPKYTNRLIRETSPYLLQHAHNPVNWFAWGDEPFARAKAEGKPVLLSIGYSTCHWCHVMERESFEDEALAAYINANYIAIKVDREQRPDVDEVYMRAVQLLTGSGGWPMTVLLTPEREPFFGGTYFPPSDQGKRPGFRSILEQLHQAYVEDPDAVLAQARELSRQVAERSKPKLSEGIPEASVITRAAAELGRSYDDEHGGFNWGRAPKFPRPVELELLLRYGLRSGDERALAWVEGTMAGMTRGGLRDRVGGGFHRYSTDVEWLVPHFEKMLYDNAQLAVALVELVQVTGKDEYAAVARETLAYLEREMSDPAGGFYSATDADSPNPATGEREEGLFFTWTKAEVEAALEPELVGVIEAVYGLSEAGNFEGRTIFQQRRALAEVAAELELEPGALAEQLTRAHEALYAVRAERPPPLRDDKILTSWNGLAISAFARAAFVLDEPAYLERARRCADFILAKHIDGEGRLLRSTLAGAPSGRAFLDDYAFLIQGLLDLFEVSGELRWLERTLALQAQLDGLYRDTEGGGYYTSASDGEVLLTRTKPSYDGAEPSGNSVAALNLLRLHEWTLDQPLRDEAEALLEALGGEAKRSPISVPKLIGALDFALGRPLQIFVVAPPGEAPAADMVAVLRTTYVPNAVRVVVGEDKVPEIQGLVPALGMKMPKDGKTTAFVCEKGVCQAPTTSAKVLAEQLERLRRPAAE